MILVRFIIFLWSVFFGIFKALCISVCTFVVPLLVISLPTPTPTRLAVLIHNALLPVNVFFLARTWFPGHLNGSLPARTPVQRLSIMPWQMLSSRPLGHANFYRSCIDILPKILSFSTTMLARFTWSVTRCYTNVQSILKSIFCSSVNTTLWVMFMFFMYLRHPSSPTSSPRDCRRHSS